MSFRLCIHCSLRLSCILTFLVFHQLSVVALLIVLDVSSRRLFVLVSLYLKFRVWKEREPEQGLSLSSIVVQQLWFATLVEFLRSLCAGDLGELNSRYGAEGSSSFCCGGLSEVSLAGLEKQAAAAQHIVFSLSPIQCGQEGGRSRVCEPVMKT